MSLLVVRKTVTTMMKARSSMGRNFIEVCKCAGWGDIGKSGVPRQLHDFFCIYVVHMLNIAFC